MGAGGGTCELLARRLQRLVGQGRLVVTLDAFAAGELCGFQQRRGRMPRHFFSFARSSSKKPCTTTSVGVPAMSAQLLSRTMRNR